MREILFRGKRDNGEWVYGDVQHNYDNEPRCISDYCGSNPVDPSTVGQFTGLYDKNGKKIFEGDIVRFGTGRVCKVTSLILPGFSAFDFVAIGGFDAPRPHNWVLFTDTEVIGNIHDNPELLEGV